MPSEWRDLSLGEFVRLQRGHDLTASEQRPGNVPVMGSAGPNGTHSEALAKGPGVVIGRSGASIGRVHYSDVDFWPHNTCLYVTDFLGNHPRFAYYLLKTLDLAGYNSGSAQPSLNRNYIYDLRLKVPLPAEQAQIVAVLQALDNRIDLLTQTNATLDSIAQALFKSWFIDFDPVRAKDEGREPEGMDAATAALFPAELEESELGLIPKGWETSTLGSLCELTKGCSYKGEGLSEEDGAFMFNLGCFNAQRVFATEKIKRYTGEYRPRHAVSPGDLIIANTDMTQARDILGRPVLVPHGFEPGFVSHHVFKVTVRPLGAHDPAALRNYLFFTFREPTFRERAVGFATGTTVLALPASAVTDCPACIPDAAPLMAWNEIVRPLFETIGLNEARAEQLASIRDTLLPRLISGKLRLPEPQEAAEAVAA
jgi:type I restriction enzyme S subunit